MSAHPDYWLIEPRGALSREDFAAIAKQIDPVIESNGRVDGLIIKTRTFPGWESLGDMIEHFRFVRDHHRAIDRVALVTDTPLAHISPPLLVILSAPMSGSLILMIRMPLSPGCVRVANRISRQGFALILSIDPEEH